MVVPISEKYNAYAEWIEKQLTLFGYYAECEKSNKTLNKKVYVLDNGRFYRTHLRNCVLRSPTTLP